MNIPPEFSLVPKDWPVQIIRDHAPWWGVWRKHCNMSENTESNYRIVSKEWIPFANGKDLTPQLMSDFFAHISKKPIRNTQINRYMTHTKAYLAWLKAMGLITHDPGFATPLAKSELPDKPKVWTHSEYKRLVEFCETKVDYHTKLWIIVLGYHTGMSMVDCSYLKWDEVSLPDDGACFIHRTRHKMRTRTGSRSQCVIPIVPGSELWVWFKRMQRARENIYKQDWYKGIDWVNHDAAEEYETKRNRDEWGFLFTKCFGAGREGRSFKNFRNSFISRLINAGVNELLVSQMTGHTNMNQLRAYVLPNLRSMQDAIVLGMKWAEENANSRLVIETTKPQSVISAGISDYQAGEQ